MIPISGEMMYVYDNKFPLIPQVLLQKIPKKPFVTKTCNKGFSQDILVYCMEGLLSTERT